MHSVGSAKEAETSVRRGVDIVVAQGWEAGGHVRGTVATMALVPAVVDAVAPVPVVAAGGIADGRGMAAALALGASGVWIGTRFLASSEAKLHPHYRERLLRASADETVYLENLVRHRLAERAASGTPQQSRERMGGGRPARARRAPRRGRNSRSFREPRRGRQVSAVHGVRRRRGRYRRAPPVGGQGVGLVRKVMPASQIVHEINAEADQILRRLSALGS